MVGASMEVEGHLSQIPALKDGGLALEGSAGMAGGFHGSMSLTSAQVGDSTRSPYMGS
jgi:hypothetical protein